MRGERRRSTGRRRAFAAVLVGALALAMTACGSDRPTPEPDGGTEVPAGAAPGDLLGTPTAFEGYQSVYASTGTALKVRYRSTSGIDDSPTVVSGIVFAPKGNPPPGGWPIVSIGHSTTGVTGDCAPSAYPDLLGSLPTVLSGIERGFVVAMTDYQGLGSPGQHPYLEPRTAGYNVIDAVRAARQAIPGTSDRWAAFGYSQGGQATWAANELAPAYGRGLQFVGSVSMAPPTDISGLVRSMEEGTITVEQMMVLPLLLRGLQVAHPDLEIDDYLHGEMAKQQEVFLACTGSRDGVKRAIASSAPVSDVKPSTPQAAALLRRLLSESALPERGASAPMFVAYGDVDQLVLPMWTEASVERACEAGDTVESLIREGEGHENLDASGPAVDWVLDRFAGRKAPDTCK
ncbi:lipase family protein [Rhodococcus daqingensis]|uniref:Lipase family protein n=1 Tax=Rhodococcus daqingensis TaxID=2479363 RepID=A0ABW2RSD2_9NOCA